jgi:DNA polymerase-3 subunit gamma/tau
VVVEKAIEETIDYNCEIRVEVIKPVFQKFANLCKERDDMNHFALFNDRDVEIEGNRITLLTDNEIQSGHLDGIKAEAVDFLRRELQIKSILIDCKVVVNTSRKLLYTSTEKYRFLAEKYPILNQLRQRLGLETDF